MGTLLAALYWVRVLLYQSYCYFISSLRYVDNFWIRFKYPNPNNIGDWLGLCPGSLAVTVVRIRKYESEFWPDMTIGFFSGAL